MEIKIVAIDKIKPYEHNARDNTKTVEKLVKLLPKTGFNVPLVLDSNHVIIKGHARYEAAKKLGMTELPCVFSDATGDNIELDRIADNKIAEFSSWKTDELMHEIDSIVTDYDFGEVGLSTPSFDDFGFDFDDTADDDVETIDEEERKRKFQQYLEEHQEEIPTVEITTQNQIVRAKEGQKKIAQVKNDYIEVKCEDCGEIIYIKKGADIYEY